MKDIRTLSVDALKKIIKELNYEEYRAKQILHWIYKTTVNSFDFMSDLPLKLRNFLSANYVIQRLLIEEQLKSIDGSIKIVFKRSDGTLFESVLMPTSYGVTLCVSVQVGCPIKCIFCATGKMKFEGNLTFYEIYDQYLYARELADQEYKKKVSNVVYMGMGEPLINIENVKKSISLLIDVGKISSSKITVSTVGIPDGIIFLANNGVRVNLAISLHSAIQATREKLIPIAKKFSLSDIKNAILTFKQKTGGKITLEYVLFSGINDDIEHMKALAEFARDLQAMVNFIEYNPTPFEDSLRPSPESKVNECISILKSYYVYSTYRRSKARDILGGCGQLALFHSQVKKTHAH